MDGGGYGGSGGGHGGSGGGFANTYVNLPNHPSWYRPAPPPLTAIDRFLWSRTQTQTQTENNLSLYQNNEINKMFIPSNGVSGFSCLSGDLAPLLPKANSFAVNGDVFVNGVGECLTWDELRNYPNYDPNRKSNQEPIKSEKIANRLNVKKPKGGPVSKALIKGQWTEEEDRKLIRLVNKHGDRKWALIAEKMIGRAGKQCRERWRNQLKPDIKKDTWSEEEERMLVEAHQKIGNKWAEITKLIPGRTENAIKNQWNATKRRQDSSRKSKKNEAKNRKSQSSLLQDYIRSKTSNDLAPSSSTTITMAAAGETPASSTINVVPELTHSNSDNSDPSLDITQSYDDELNFMQSLFGITTTATSNDSSGHVKTPVGFSGELQRGFSSSSSTHDESSNLYLNNYPEEDSLKTHLEEAITMAGFSDHGCHGDDSSLNGKNRWFW